jgi:hypothetical protein
MTATAYTVKITAQGKRFGKVLDRIKSVKRGGGVAEYDGDTKTWTVHVQPDRSADWLHDLARDGEVEILEIAEV